MEPSTAKRQSPAALSRPFFSLAITEMLGSVFLLCWTYNWIPFDSLTLPDIASIKGIGAGTVIYAAVQLIWSAALYKRGKQAADDPKALNIWCLTLDKVKGQIDQMIAALPIFTLVLVAIEWVLDGTAYFLILGGICLSVALSVQPPLQKMADFRKSV